MLDSNDRIAEINKLNEPVKPKLSQPEKELQNTTTQLLEVLINKQ